MTKKRDARQVVFGAKDDDIVEFLDEVEVPFSTYVKNLIRKQMEVDDSSAIIEARLNEIVTILKKAGGNTPAPAPIQKQASSPRSGSGTTLSSKDKSTINNVLGVFKT